MRVQRINHVLDVGANVGQYASELRALGYAGKITSFEPGRFAFAVLEEASRRDDAWQAFNYGLSDVDGPLALTLSENSVSSSLQQVLPSLTP